MKPEVLQTLLTAKVLFNQAQDFCFIEDKHTSSAGLLILQDALELIFLGCLIELGIDENKSLENTSFDQLIGELKKKNIKVIKSGTLKALNKQRVIIKHYGQVSEPSSVRNYFSAAQESTNVIMQQIFSKTLQDILLHELIRSAEVKNYFSIASEALEQEKYLAVLVNVRKAIYIEVEKDYCIYDWRDVDPNEPPFIGLGRGGYKAPWYTRNREWIEKNVSNPFAYIQIDHDRLRQDVMEWGANTQDYFNITRLTPQVMRLTHDGKWLIKEESEHIYQSSNLENARYCLDRAVTFLSKKQAYQDLGRSLNYEAKHGLKVKINKRTKLYEKALQIMSRF
ncbi:hypothetical protein MYX76_13365 [Desulfobacterota bacterium AH_259_B03_O07]|nr:hypothetical protein [Desulfobacterota bacterium AH_259_B03_O07]